MLGRLVMATEGRWQPEGDVPDLLAAKLSECLWWILVLGDRVDVDIDAAFAGRMARSKPTCSRASPPSSRRREDEPPAGSGHSTQLWASSRSPSLG
jgi:hypothetical protein